MLGSSMSHSHTSHLTPSPARVQPSPSPSPYTPSPRRKASKSFSAGNVRYMTRGQSDSWPIVQSPDIEDLPTPRTLTPLPPPSVTIAPPSTFPLGFLTGALLSTFLILTILSPFQDDTATPSWAVRGCGLPFRPWHVDLVRIDVLVELTGK